MKPVATAFRYWPRKGSIQYVKRKPEFSKKYICIITGVPMWALLMMHWTSPFRNPLGPGSRHPKQRTSLYRDHHDRDLTVQGPPQQGTSLYRDPHCPSPPSEPWPQSSGQPRSLDMEPPSLETSGAVCKRVVPLECFLVAPISTE